MVVEADLADPDAVRRMVDAAAEALGGLDVLVNNAGIYLWHPVAEVSYEQWQAAWQETLAVNLIGAANAAWCAVQHMIGQGGGRIVNVASRGAFRGEPRHPAYGASKAGLHAFGQSLAKALAPHGIAVATVAPGYVATDMAAEYLAGPDGDAIRADSPFGRVAEADEIAAAVRVPGLTAGRVGQRRHPRPQRRLLPPVVASLAAFLSATRGRRPIALGSRPASSQPPATATSGMPTRMSSRLASGMLVSDERLSSWLARKKPIAATYPATMPTTAPTSASAPAVAAEMARRAVLPAPVAVSVRRSLAVSLRSRPTLMARMPRASRMPKAVATSRMSADAGMLLRASTVRAVAAAVCWAVLIWLAVSEPGVWMSQPARGDGQVELAHGVLGDHGVRRRCAGRQRADLLDARIRPAVARRAG